MRRLISACAVVLAAFHTTGAKSGPADELSAGYFKDLDVVIDRMLADPALADLILDQNATNDDLSEEGILEQDGAWRENDPEIRAGVMENALSAFLKTVVDGENGRIGELIVMDDRGMNVGVWPATSDYWQGDEDKFTETFPRGGDATHIARVDFDESVGVFQQQLSSTITLRGRRIGAITLGVNIEHR